MNRTLALTSIALAISGGLAFAQNAAKPASPAPPAIASGSSAPTYAAPAAGENSFTKAQAKKRLEDNGFSQVGDLNQDDHHVWHATAVKNGKQVPVTLDYQGNIGVQ